MPASTKRGDSEPLLLLADAMLGRLAKWLRLMGYDTVYDNVSDDHELARRSRAEGRVLLTRDRELAGRTGLRTLYITSEDYEEQIREVERELGPPPDPNLSRCSICNELLIEVQGAEVAPRIPAYVLQTHSHFRRCPNCERIYWPGSHVEGIVEVMNGVEPHREEPQ